MEARETLRSAGRVAAALLLAAALPLGAAPTGAAGQALPLKTSPGVAVRPGCPQSRAERPAAPTEMARAEAERLAASATQAAILGDPASAREMLQKAATLDRTSAYLARQLARALDGEGKSPEAVSEYCRYLRLDPSARDAADVRARVVTLAPGLGLALDPGHVAFAAGVASFRRGQAAEAEASFSAALRARPSWPEAFYDRAVARAAQARDALAVADLRHYLALVPDAPDRRLVLAWIAARERASIDPRLVLAAGLAVPGLAEFQMGRPERGLLVVGVAGAGVAVGLLKKTVHVDCLSDPVRGVCPPDDVQGHRTERPLLAPGVGVALAAMAIGAYDGWRFAKERVARERGLGGAAAGGRDVEVGVRLLGAGADGVRTELVRLRF
ncbi:MAG TPA: hypothetical protein VFQ38_06630 [Longimicrobiales bacterium]|nr:hypothetical protein [Longimicrobiales bacterium]